MDKKLHERDETRVPQKQFDAALDRFRELDPKAAAGLALAAADIAMVVDADGVVADVAFHNASFTDEGVTKWIGRPWLELVTVESKPKVESLLAEARSSQFSRKREVNHLRTSAGDLPLRYSAVPLGNSGAVLVLGTDLRPIAEQQQQLINAQQTMEREYAKLRQAEGRYRLLFRLAFEAVLVLDAARETVVDANPTCVDMLSRPINQIADHKLATLFEKSSWAVLTDLLATVRSGAKAGEIDVKLQDGRQVRLAATLFRQDGVAQMLIRLAPQVQGRDRSETGKVGTAVVAAIEALPDGFVVTDEEGVVLSANPAFCDLAGVVSFSQVSGRKLSEWVGRTSVDLGLIMSNLREHGAVRNFATMVCDDIGSEERVVLSAAASTENGTRCLGFMLRRAGMAGAAGTGMVPPMMRSANQLTELVGRVPMKELVRETTDMIEKMCIEAALELTGNNRASAADMLGLSRQSFYIKLRRHGMIDGDGDQ